ncbi:MAG: hypothetical protein ABL986_16275 [Vicinamibacterales bacterium]
MRRLLIVVAGCAVLCAPVAGQARRTAPRATAAPTPPALTTIEVALDCPSPLGTGVQTRRVYCDVMTGRDQAEGIIIKLPPHSGPATLSFQLHNRHLYSEELIKTGRGYRRYTATIGVLTADNTLLSRFVVQNEFRTAADLIERISAETVPGQVKAVAPTGAENISVVIPAEETAVSILGEKLTVIRPDGVDEFRSPGRPVAVVSRVSLEYRPPAPARPAPRRR